MDEVSVAEIKQERDLWREKAERLEQQSPEHMETVLSERIAARDKEIARLGNNTEANARELESALEEKALLERALAHTKTFRAMVALEVDGDEPDPTDYEDEVFGFYGDVQVVKLGSVGVDSGQLMITDPCYIDSEWQEQAFVDVRILDDQETGKSFEFRKDFTKYSEVLPNYGRTVNELISDGVLVQRPPERPDAFAYSYRGAATAILTEGHGELVYREGHPGAGLAFATAYGDGMYSVYGEIRDGQIVRVYVDVS